jgi:MYXO-CTERM domain-containing protein
LDKRGFGNQVPSTPMLPRSLALLLAPALVLAPGLAEAQGPTESSEFSPWYERLLLGFEDAAVDTGWIPGGSPVQMRFFADAANSITIDLPGVADYDWRTEELSFTGDPLAGVFEYDVGLELVASVKVDTSLVQWQSDLLGPYDWGIEAITEFTPYLLDGNPDRPAQIQDTSGAFDLVSIPLIPDILILSGSLDIALYVDIQASLHCTRIDVLGLDGTITSFTSEGESRWIDPGSLDELADPDDPDAALVLPATAYCHIQTQPTLIINPHLVVSVLFDDYDIAGIDIPVPLPVLDDEIAFDTIDLSFPRWQAPEPDPDPSGDEGGDEGGESGDDGGSGELGDETGGDELGAGYEDDGCNCATEPSRGGALGGPGGALGGLALLALIRRRRPGAARAAASASAARRSSTPAD